MNKLNKTVFIVDDNTDFSTSLAWMLRGEGYNSIEFNDPEKAITALKLADQESLSNCCLLLDIRMPNKNGLEVHDELHDAKLNFPIIYMTGHADVPLAVEVMKKGAVTILEKPFDETKLMGTLDQVFSGALPAMLPPGIPGSGNASSKRANGDSSQEPAIVLDREFSERLVSLTKRESEVLDQIVEGGSNKVIAYNLGISIRTVEVHRARLMKKLGTRSAPELVRKVLQFRNSVNVAESSAGAMH